MASTSSNVEGNSSIEVDVRFMLTQCECGELADVKITKSNKNNNRGRMYYTCKRQRCGSFLGWCKIASIHGYTSNTNATVEQFRLASRDGVGGEVNAKLEFMPWKFLFILAFILFTLVSTKVM